MNELHLFSGAGGGILGGMLLGHTTVCAVEIEPYCRKVLLQRQRDGILPRFPIWDDVRTFDGTAWRGKVDVVAGGFPCTDISCAGKGAGIEGEKSGLWKEMARIIGEVRPRYAFVENSPMLVGRGLAMVLGDLAEMGYDAQWCIVSASDVGAPHKRDRIWIRAELADSNSNGAERCESKLSRADTGTNGCSEENMANADMQHGKRRSESQQPTGESWKSRDQHSRGSAECRDTWWIKDPADGTVKPFMGRVAHGVAHRVDRLKAIGNGQVPACAAMAWQILTEGKQ